MLLEVPKVLVLGKYTGSIECATLGDNIIPHYPHRLRHIFLRYRQRLYQDPSLDPMPPEIRNTFQKEKSIVKVLLKLL